MSVIRRTRHLFKLTMFIVAFMMLAPSVAFANVGIASTDSENDGSIQKNVQQSIEGVFDNTSDAKIGSEEKNTETAKINDDIKETEEFKIQTMATEGGWIDSTTTVNKGESITINYAPIEKYSIRSIIVDGTRVDVANYPKSYTFENVKENHDIKIVYDIKAVILSGEGGEATAEGSTPTEVGSAAIVVGGKTLNQPSVVNKSEKKTASSNKLAVSNRKESTLENGEEVNFVATGNDNATKNLSANNNIKASNNTKVSGTQVSDSIMKEDSRNYKEPIGIVLICLLIGTMVAVVATAVGVRKRAIAK